MLYAYVNIIPTKYIFHLMLLGWKILKTLPKSRLTNKSCERKNTQKKPHHHHIAYTSIYIASRTMITNKKNKLKLIAKKIAIMRL